MGVVRAWQLVRPRTLTQLFKTVQDTASQARDLRSSVKLLRTGQESGLERLQALERQVRELDAALAESRLRESQLRAIMERDHALAREEAELTPRLKDRDTIARHVTAAITAAPLHPEPFPFAVADDVLPQWLYDGLITGLPPAELFADRPVKKQQLAVPFGLAPSYSRRVWRFMAKRVVDEMIQPVVLEMFREPLAGWIRQSFPQHDVSAHAAMPVTISDGRILLRRPGYVIRPHRDPKWGMITCLFYLARPGDDERWGTDLYTVEQDEAAPNLRPHWIDPARCRLAHEVRFRPNRMLIFLNSRGAHAARIPADAQPATLERYVYQFRIGPTVEWMNALVESLPTDVKAAWSGKFGDY
jgi:hypothetical protein